MKRLTLVGIAGSLLVLGACTGTPEEIASQCATAQRGFLAAKAISTGVNLSPQHRATADQATMAAGILVEALCPAAVVAALD